jgi:hypothetical protein
VIALSITWGVLTDSGSWWFRLQRGGSDGRHLILAETPGEKLKTHHPHLRHSQAAQLYFSFIFNTTSQNHLRNA